MEESVDFVAEGIPSEWVASGCGCMKDVQLSVTWAEKNYVVFSQ